MTAPSASSLLPMMTANVGAAAVGRLHLRLHAAVLEARSALKPAARSSLGDQQRLETTGRVDDEHVDAPSGAANTPSSSQASNVRSMPRAKPMPGVGGPPSASTRPS